MKPDTYSDFVAWRDDHDCERVTVGDAMRHFSGTPLRTLLDWWARDQQEQAAKLTPTSEARP